MAAASGDTEYVEHPLIAEGTIERRDYQTNLSAAARRDHTLVCLPTGLGKTTVSLLVTAHRLQSVGGKALLLAPTKPLVAQHADFYRNALTLSPTDVTVFTGEVSPSDRTSQWDDSTIVIATPQVVENDLVGNRISLESVTHLTFDECHRATGEYAYNYVADRYHADAADPLVTGMSASPGGDKESILTVCRNLGISNVEVMTEDDADVAAHTHETTVDWERVELPDDVLAIRDLLHEVVSDRLETLADLGVTSFTDPGITESEIRKIQANLQRLMDDDQSEGYEGMSVLAEVRKLRTALTYVETQSVESARRYFIRQKEAARSSGASKADQRMVSDPRVRRAIRMCRNHDELHPKFRRTRMLVAETLGIENGERVIVFTESRDTAEALTDFLGEHFTTRKFVGQSDTGSSDGMTQREQQETLTAFRDGEFEVLVSTSVAEEGLDVPEVDLVLFYEPVPTAIRSIQRKGRTGRQTEGRVVVLLAEDTRDEAYFWKARRDEQQMEDELRALKDIAGDIESELAPQTGLDDVTSGGTERVNANPPQETQADTSPVPNARSNEQGQSGLDAFSSNDSADSPDVARAGAQEAGIEIVVDQREMDASIARELSRKDHVETRLETLEIGDYVLSDRVVVERKSVEDFLETLTGGERSLFEQVGDAASHYQRPIVLIEGENVFGKRNIHPKAIHGALASLAVDFGASVLRTRDQDESATLLETIATREQQSGDREVSVHGEKQSRTLAEQQEYTVASIAEVGPVTARSLLEAFGSVEAVMTAEAEQLVGVQGVGEVTAERIRDVVASEYDPQ